MTKLDTEAGYTTIQQDPVEIIYSYDKIIHIINLNEIEQLINIIENQITNSYQIYTNKNSYKILQNRINKVKHSFKTLIPLRHKRALINIGGSLLKFIFGTMDQEDKIEIENHLKLIDQNNKNIITTINKQIKINSIIQDNINTIKNNINQSHLIIEKISNYISNDHRNVVNQLQYLNILSNINLLNDEVEKIQENVMFAKHQTMIRSILTPEEINDYNIDIFKIQELKSSVATRNNTLIFILQIPKISEQKANNF